MNILHAVLAVDVAELFDNDFSKVVLKLVNGLKVKTIKAEKFDDADNPFPIVIYSISNRKFTVPIFANEDSRGFSYSLRRRASEEARKVKAELEELVSLASLSVYRIGSDVDPDSRERPGKRPLSPVDVRLTALMQRLTHYQLELSTEERRISSRLQRDVLVSLLYQKGAASEPKLSFSFDEALERKNLVSAYKQLGVTGSDITKRIQEHTTAINEATGRVNAVLNSSSADYKDIDLAPLEAYQRTRNVIDLSLDASRRIDRVYEQIKTFLDILHDFIPDKNFSLKSGDLSVDGNSDVTIQRLSSGEKQLLILFIEALLQRKKPYIFMADEPELSLHISWQRKILPAIRRINENAQIIVATHSPEVASNFPEKILDMEDLRNG